MKEFDANQKGLLISHLLIDKKLLEFLFGQIWLLLRQVIQRLSSLNLFHNIILHYSQCPRRSKFYICNQCEYLLISCFYSLKIKYNNIVISIWFCIYKYKNCLHHIRMIQKFQQLIWNGYVFYVLNLIIILMIFQLDYKNEEEIPYYFKCIICRKVPKQSMVDIECQFICCFKCQKQYTESFQQVLVSCKEIEQRALDKITIQCQACQKKVAANQKSKHSKECIIYHSNFQLENQVIKKNLNLFQNNLFCKYCQKFNCQECFIIVKQNNLGEQLNLSEYVVDIKKNEFEICQYCLSQIFHFDINDHQIECNQSITVCELCKKAIIRELYIKHYQQCIHELLVNIKNELEINQIGQNLIDIQIQTYHCNHRNGFEYEQLRCFFENVSTAGDE
ncbi:hypothetical protein pb186bvf_008015 [Paramecium bursaria]